MKDIFKAGLILILVTVLTVIVFWCVQKATEATTEVRIDISVPKANKKQLEVIFQGNKLESSTWAEGREYYENKSAKKKIEINVKPIETVQVTIDLRTHWKINQQGKTVAQWAKYTSLKINGKEQLIEPKEVWHDQNYEFQYDMKAGNIYTIEAIWEPIEK